MFNAPSDLHVSGSLDSRHTTEHKKSIVGYVTQDDNVKYRTTHLKSLNSSSTPQSRASESSRELLSELQQGPDVNTLAIALRIVPTSAERDRLVKSLLHMTSLRDLRLIYPEAATAADTRVADLPSLEALSIIGAGPESEERRCEMAAVHPHLRTHLLPYPRPRYCPSSCQWRRRHTRLRTKLEPNYLPLRYQWQHTLSYLPV